LELSLGLKFLQTQCDRDPSASLRLQKKVFQSFGILFFGADFGTMFGRKQQKLYANSKTANMAPMGENLKKKYIALSPQELLWLKIAIVQIQNVQGQELVSQKP